MMTTSMGKECSLLSILFLYMSLIQANSCCGVWSSFTSMSTATLDIAPNHLLDLCFSDPRHFVQMFPCSFSFSAATLVLFVDQSHLRIQTPSVASIGGAGALATSELHHLYLFPLSPRCRLPLRCSFSSALCRSNGL